jgi:hypothetical protein
MRGLGTNPGIICDSSGNPPGCWVPNGTPGSNIGVLESTGVLSPSANLNSRAGFVSLMQLIGGSGLDSSVSSSGSATPSVLGGYFAASVNSYPTAYTSSGCPYQTQMACAVPFSGSQYSQVFDPGTFYDLVTAAQNAAQAGPAQANLATNYVAPVPNATTAYVSGSQVISAQSGQPVTPGPIISTATPGASPGSAPATSTSATSACSFALFGETSCIGPVGTTTALVIGGALLALFLLMGGKR